MSSSPLAGRVEEDPSRSPSPASVTAVAWATAVGALCLWQAASPSGAVGYATYYLGMAMAVAAAWVGVTTLRRQRVVGALLAGAVTATVLADAVFDVRAATTGQAPETSLADVGWLLSYVMVGAAVAVLLRSERGAARRDVDGLVELTIRA